MPYCVATKKGLVVTWLIKTRRHFLCAGNCPLGCAACAALAKPLMAPAAARMPAPPCISRRRLMFSSFDLASSLLISLLMASHSLFFIYCSWCSAVFNLAVVSGGCSLSPTAVDNKFLSCTGDAVVGCQKQGHGGDMLAHHAQW